MPTTAVEDVSDTIGSTEITSNIARGSINGSFGRVRAFSSPPLTRMDERPHVQMGKCRPCIVRTSSSWTKSSLPS